MPKGLNGVKQRFVRWDTYGLFRTMRNAYRTGRRAQHAISATVRRPH
jgi:hypothetical protein